MSAIGQAGLRLGRGIVAVLAFTAAATATLPYAASAASDSVNVNSPDSDAAYNATIPGAAPFRKPFADNSIHNHVSVETNAVELANWQPRFDGPGGEDNYEPTDLSFTKVSAYTSSVDIYWEVTFIPGHVGGTYECKDWASSTRCNRAKITIADDAESMSDLLQNNLVCHEIGHSVGFGHGTVGASCMTGGENNRLAWWEIQTINTKY